MKIVNNTAYIVMACLTLGLAPFFPEPHVWGKLKWVAGGAVGLQAMDYFDLLMHGFPWLLLIRLIIIKSINALKTSK